MKSEKLRFHKTLLAMIVLIAVWSVIHPYNLQFWAATMLPILIIVALLISTYKKFTFTTFTYVMIFTLLVILLIGAKYTYSHNPFFEWIKNQLGLERNYYDRVGHLAQGFFPVLAVREFLLRKGYMRESKVFNIVLICIMLASSAFYELLEFFATIVMGYPNNTIISPQGDPWDTQWDMVMAIIGGIVSLVIFRKPQNRAIKKVFHEEHS